jgi:hypothetical protein
MLVVPLMRNLPVMVIKPRMILSVSIVPILIGLILVVSAPVLAALTLVVSVLVLSMVLCASSCTRPQGSIHRSNLSA